MRITPAGTHPTIPAQPAPLLLTVEEAAALLRIGRTLMYHLISTGAIASVTVGRLRRVRLADLQSYTVRLSPAQHTTAA